VAFEPGGTATGRQRLLGGCALMLARPPDQENRWSVSSDSGTMTLKPASRGHP
jgi:hypothetical protein